MVSESGLVNGVDYLLRLLDDLTVEMADIDCNGDGRWCIYS
jgi:hypothetical protein